MLYSSHVHAVAPVVVPVVRGSVVSIDEPTRTRTRKRMRTIAGMRMWIATRRRRMRMSGTSRGKQGLAK